MIKNVQVEFAKVKTESNPTFSSMKVGDVARILDGHRKDHIVLRTYSRIVSLTDPATTWTSPFGDAQVELLPPGTKVIIEIGL